VEGRVSNAAIGACLQSDAQELADISTSVEFIDNGTNFESTSLPVPEAVGAAE
jgi:hypothetical protein